MMTIKIVLYYNELGPLNYKMKAKNEYVNQI